MFEMWTRATIISVHNLVGCLVLFLKKLRVRKVVTPDPYSESLALKSWLRDRLLRDRFFVELRRSPRKCRYRTLKQATSDSTDIERTHRSSEGQELFT